LRTGKLIVYTSSDSVFQIAAHEETVPVEELYEYCLMAREMLKGDFEVVRVIARPFTGEPGSFIRTPRRRDFSLVPPRTYLNLLQEIAVPIHGVGKISQIFAGSGVDHEHKTTSNAEGINKTISIMREINEGLVFTNLVDFDMLWGHRNDYRGFAAGLEEADAAIPELIATCGERDMMIVTADHGCDPTVPGTDHTREYIPMLARMGKDVFSPGGPMFASEKPRSPGSKEIIELATEAPYEGEFADVGATVFRFFTGSKLEVAEALSMPGKPFIKQPDRKNGNIE
ncbi:MAG: phosphopentomutase, partial [Thermoleophilia bacterium]